MRNKRTGDPAPKLIGWFLGSVGIIFLLVAGGVGYRRVQIIQTWPEVSGEVTRSRVNSYYSKGTRMYEVDLEFRYRIDGFEHVNPAPSNYATSSAGGMKAKAARYPVGSLHPIKVNPRDPDDIRLSEGYTFGVFFLPLIFGLLGSILTVVGAVVLIRIGKAQNRSRARS